MRQDYLRTYFIMGSQDCIREPETILEEALKAGITAFQFREKGAGSLAGEEKIALGKRLRALCREYDVPFFINDDVDLIETLAVDGVHVGQDDMNAAVLREKYPDLLIGLSVATMDEVANSPLDAVDYIGAGPVFPTGTKLDAAEVVGPEWLNLLRREFPELPIVGIGGITMENAGLVLAAGVNGVAVVSAISQADDIAAAVENL